MAFEIKKIFVDDSSGGIFSGEDIKTDAICGVSGVLITNGCPECVLSFEKGDSGTDWTSQKMGPAKVLSSSFHAGNNFIDITVADEIEVVPRKLVVSEDENEDVKPTLSNEDVNFDEVMGHVKEQFVRAVNISNGKNPEDKLAQITDVQAKNALASFDVTGKLKEAREDNPREVHIKDFGNGINIFISGEQDGKPSHSALLDSMNAEHDSEMVKLLSGVRYVKLSDNNQGKVTAKRTEDMVGYCVMQAKELKAQR